jgi:glycosyltransferase involved in cell wall biosynthesis
MKLYKSLAQNETVHQVSLYSRFKNTVEVTNLDQKVFVRNILVRTFGLRFVMNKLLKQDFQPSNYIPRLPQFIKADAPTHVVAFDFYHLFVLQLLYCKKKNDFSLFLWCETKRLPQRFASRWMMYFFARLIRARSNDIAAIFVYTTEGEFFIKKLFPDISISIVPAPVEIQSYDSKSSGWYQNDTLRILMNARYSAYKNHQDLFAAVKQMRTAGKKVLVTCIGRADGGRKNVEQIVERLDIRNAVSFIDPIDKSQINELNHQHDVLVLPSYNEAIGMVVPEAMACGLPTVTSDTVGANIYVTENETGYIFPTGDVAALTEKLIFLCDPETLSKMGGSAREKIEQFTPGIIADSLLEKMSSQ